MGFTIQGSVSGNGLEVTAANEMKVALTNVNANIGTVNAAHGMDTGTITGVPLYRAPDVSRVHRVKVSQQTVLLEDTFNSTVQNTQKWYYAFATMTASQPGNGQLQFGTVQGTANGHYATMRSFQYFSTKTLGSLTCCADLGSFTNGLVANEAFAWGFGIPGVASLPPDGVMFQLTSGGLYGLIYYNGVLLGTPLWLAPASIATNQYYRFVFRVYQDYVEFWYDTGLAGAAGANDRVFLGGIETPAGYNAPIMQASLPMFMMKYCSGVVSNTNVIRVGQVSVALNDLDTHLPYQTQLCMMGQGGYTTQNGVTIAPTQFIGTITSGSSPINPTTAAPSNTTQNNSMSATTGWGLGGITNLNATASAATDFIAQAYQNPSSTVNITGKNLLINGITISSINLGAIVATTPTTLLFTLAYGATALSLATVETASFATATTHQPRRVQLGFQSAIAAVPIGGMYTPTIQQPFINPIVVRPGEWVVVMYKVVVGTATGSQTICMNITFDACFE